ncbi:MAG: helix-hairpin-helix domain-containing protein [Candidatus Brocadiales bacterium]
MKIPKSLEPLELSRREFVVLCVLFSTLMVGIVVKFVIDNHLGSGDIKVLRQNPEELSLRLDVNAVTWQELLPLPKIGEKRAKAIIKYRGEHGAFTDLNELLDVPGITPKVFETVRGSMKVSGENIKVYGERTE